MIAAETSVAPVSAVVIPSDFGNWEGKLNSGRVNPDCICPTPPSSGQPTTPSASPTNVDPHWARSSPTSRPLTSSWLIHVSTSSQPIQARASRICR